MKRREDVKMVSINSLENSMSSGSLGFYPAIIYAGRGNFLVKIVSQIILMIFHM